MLAKLRATLREFRGFIIFIILMSIFRSSIADWNHVPTGSMRPTIIEGDRVLVNKLAYDVQVPFIHTSLIRLANPARGDVVIFDSAVSGKRLIKRVVAIPGDEVSMQGNRLVINGHPLGYESSGFDGEAPVFIESTLDQRRRVRLGLTQSRSATFSAQRVPEGQYLVLGDNRNNSADSRFIGFVPRGEIVGRSRTVVMSLNMDKFYIPRGERFWQALDL